MDNVISKLRDSLQATNSKTSSGLLNGAMIELRNLDREAYGEALSILVSSNKNAAEVISFLENYSKSKNEAEVQPDLRGRAVKKSEVVLEKEWEHKYEYEGKIYNRLAVVTMFENWLKDNDEDYSQVDETDINYFIKNKIPKDFQEEARQWLKDSYMGEADHFDQQEILNGFAEWIKDYVDPSQVDEGVIDEYIEDSINVDGDQPRSALEEARQWLIDAYLKVDVLESTGAEYCLVLPTVKSEDEVNKIVEMLKEQGIESYFFSR